MRINTIKYREATMLFVYPSKTVFDNKYGRLQRFEKKDDHFSPGDKVSLEIELQRLRWIYKNMREKKRFLE
jgi:hypothetical protein